MFIEVIVYSELTNNLKFKIIPTCAGRIEFKISHSGTKKSLFSTIFKKLNFAFDVISRFWDSWAKITKLKSVKKPGWDQSPWF